MPKYIYHVFVIFKKEYSINIKPAHGYYSSERVLEKDELMNQFFKGPQIIEHLKEGYAVIHSEVLPIISGIINHYVTIVN